MTVNSGGVKIINKSFPVIEAWRKYSPNAIIHLELASTQDVAIRKAIIKTKSFKSPTSTKKPIRIFTAPDKKNDIKNITN